MSEGLCVFTDCFRARWDELTLPLYIDGFLLQLNSPLSVSLSALAFSLSHPLSLAG